MTFSPAARRMIPATAIFLAIALTLFLVGPSGKGVSLAQANGQGGNSPATGLATITGTVQVGETLTADTSGVADADGLSNVQYEYQWLADDADIAGATSLTYTLIDVDEGKAIKVQVSFTDDEGNAETLISAATAAVTAAPPSITPGEPQNLELTPVAVGTNGVGIKVFWDAASATGDSDISGYRIQWKGGNQDYPDDQETRQAFVENAPYTIDTSSPSPIEGDELTVRVTAVNGAGAGVWTEKIGWLPENNTDLKLWLLMKEYADEKQTTFPWVLETWNYLDRYEVPVEVGPTPGLGGVPLLPCVRSYTDGDDGLKECHIRNITILQIEDPKPRVIIHEMAHAYTLANRVTDAPVPLAIGHLYFDSLNLQGGLRGCEPLELYADVLTMLTLDIDKSSYWKTCNGDNAQREAHALDVLRSAVNGEMPQWFADTYTDSEGEVDLEHLWADVQDLPGREWNVVIYQLRNAFGGYCNNELTWKSVDYSDDNLTQPWVDGGCPPPEPSSLEVTPGNGELTLAWDAPANDGDSDVDGYIVQWRSGYQSYYGWAARQRRAVLDSPTSLTYTISGLTNGVEYDVRVRAYNHIGPGQPLDLESVTPSEAATPAIPENTPATGAPTISGTAQVGETLTANTSGIADADGLANATFSYQWLADDAEIAGATGSTYTLTDSEESKAIKVEVSFTDDADNDETLTSAATAAVAAANIPATGAPTISGTARVGEVLTVDTSGISDEDGMENASFSFTWGASGYFRATGAVTEYTIQPDDEGKTVDVTASFKDDKGNWEIVDSAPTSVVEAQPNNPATGAPTITGTAQVGETLTADTSGIADADELSNVQYEYQWLADDSDISGATNATYTLVAEDEGKAVTVQVSFTDDRGHEETLTSGATGAVDARPNSSATGAPTISGTAQVGETLTADTSGVVDADGLSNVQYEYQWLADDTDIAGATGLTYTLTDSEESKVITVRVSFTDDAGHNETLTSAATAAVAAAPPPPPDNVRAVTQESGAVELTWEAPGGATVTGYRIERRRAAAHGNDQQRSAGGPTDHHTLVEDSGSADTGYTDESAERGVEYEYRVSARNESGPGEGSDWVRAGPESASNAPATGAPTISGTAQVGETLTADITGISDVDGLSGETFTYQWVSSDGTTDTDMEKATGSTYTLVEADQGKSVKVRVTFTDGGGNEETLTSAPTAPVWGDGLPGAPRNLTAAAGDREITLSWDPAEDNGNAPATRYRIEWRIDGKDYTRLQWGTSRSTTYTTNDQANLANGVKYFFRVKAENDDGNSYGPYGPSSGEVSATPTSGSAVDLGTPVLSEPENLHHRMVKLDWQDIEDAGWYVVQYYHLDGGNGEWVDLPAVGVDIAFHGSSAVVSNLDYGIHWLRVGAASCAGSSEWSQIVEFIGTQESDWEGVPVPEVEEGDEIEPCPVVLGTPVLSEPENLHHRMMRLDWQDMEDAGWYVVQYYHIGGGSGEWLDLPAVGVDIAFHGSGAVVSNLDYGIHWLRVGAASCAGESEWSQIEELYGTNASDWEGVPVPEVEEGDEIEPCSEDADTPDNSPATGAPTISGTAQVGEALEADTSGISDADGLSNVQYEYQWLADDADISGATGSTYTLTDSEESKAIKVEVSFTDDAGNEETLTSVATEAEAAAPTPNSPATGVPTISGTAQVDETLTADTSGVADADGLSNVQYEYQWLADDTDISGATNATYTLVAEDEGKAFTVQVRFTDDADNEETLTSVATAAVAGAQPTEPPDQPTGLEATAATHDSVTLTWDDPGDDTITGYVILRRVRVNDTGGDFDELVADTKTAATTYTDDTVAAGLTYTYRIKAINGAGTSERSRWSHIDVLAAPVPDQPTGLEATATHDSVTLTWDDPGDDSITGYVILRRVRENDTGGDFSVLVADTGSAATTYTDDTVAAGATYTYRIKAINEHGVSERSSWYHIDIPEAP